jgi:hypothetical protein
LEEVHFALHTSAPGVSTRLPAGHWTFTQFGLTENVDVASEG